MRLTITSLLLLVGLMISKPASAQILLTTQNTVNIRGEINQGSIAKAKYELYRLSIARGSMKYPIYLVMNTPGGDIQAGEDFIQFARSFRDVETITIFAASMGSGIVQGVGGKRHILPSGTMMFHRATLGLQGRVSEGEFESRLAYIKTVILQLELRNANRLGIDLVTYKSRVKDELWYYGMQALVNRAADDIVSVTCTPQLVNKKETVIIDLGFLQIEREQSYCPTL